MANTESNLDVNIRGTDGLTPALAQIESKLIRFVGAVSSALTAIRVVGFPVDAVRQFEAGMAQVQKTTNYTTNQIKTLGDELVNMSRTINVSAVDLATIAAAAGQQGLGREGVEGIRQFTESVSRMASVLDITAQEAGTNVGKIATVFKVSLRDIEQVSSAFNQVSNNSSASGEQLLDIVKRIGNASGSINLQQSIGLAATGVELGQSPEVVGTAFSKMFAEMFGKADKFAKILKISTKDWMAALQGDGIKALKMYLEALRGMTASEQAKWGKLLTGGGRNAVLLSKLIQDSQNATLDKNLANGQEGFLGGTSSIKEQLTVLSTMDAQITELQNSFTALGIKSGQVFGPRLTAYLAKLNIALANPAVVQFAEKIGAAMLDIFDSAAELIKWVASLNVNFENFVQVLKVMLALKVAQWFISSLGSIPLLGGALNKLGLDAIRAGEMQAAGTKVANTALQNQILRIKELMAQQAARTAAQKAAVAAEIAQSKALEAQKVAEAAAFTAANKLKSGNAVIAAAGATVTSSRAAVGAAEATATAAVAAARQALNARLEQSQLAHEARMTAIVAQAEVQRAEARAAGSKLGVAIINATEVEMLAAEKAFQVKSLASINSYYGRRVAAAEAAGIAEVAASKLQFMHSLSAFDGAAGSRGFGVLTVQARNAAAAMALADKAVVKTTADLVATREAAALAGTGFTRLATAVKIAGTAFNLLLGIAGKLFLWVTVIYMVLDAFHLLDGIPTILQGITDWLGLTSEAQRKVAEDTKTASEAQEEYNRKLTEAIEVMQKFIDKRTGLFADGTISALKSNLKDADPNVAQQARTQLGQMVAGTVADQELVKQTQGALPDLAANTKAELDKTLATIAEGKRRIEAEKLALRAPVGFEGAINTMSVINAPSKAEMAALEHQAASLQEKLAAIGPEAARATDISVDHVAQNLTKLKGLISEAFTPESAQLFTKFMPEYLAALDTVEKATVASKKAAAAFTSEENSEDAKLKERLKQDALDAITVLNAANRAKGQVEQDMNAEIVRLKTAGGLSEAAIGSLDKMKEFMDFTVPQIKGILGLLREISGVGPKRVGDFAAFSGTLAPAPDVPKSGTGTLADTGNGKSEARALSKARVELARATLQAEANLEKQGITEKQAALEYSNKRSLETIKGYYAERLRLSQENNDIEIRLKADEIAAMAKEEQEAEAQSSKVRIQGQIVKAKGEMDLLKLQRSAMVDISGREEADAIREFGDKVQQQRNALVDYFGATSDNEAFQVALDTAANGYRDFVQKLRTEAKGNPKLLEMANQIELQGKFQAVEAALKHIGEEAAVATGHFDILDAHITMLRDNGTITAAEASGAYADIRRSVIKVKESEIERSENQLKDLYDGTKAIEDQSLAYKKLALDIEGNKQTLEVLKTKANDVATEINTDFRNSFSEMLQGLAHGEGVQEAMTNFALAVLDSLAKASADGLADMLMQKMGGMGGGLGGLFASLTGADGGAGAPGTPAVEAAKTAGADPLTKGLESITSGLSSLGSMLMGGLSSVTGGITNALGSGLDGLMSFLGPLFTSIVTAIFGASATSAGAGAAQQGFGALAAAAMAHNGGIAGQFNMSRSGVGLLGDGVRYHSGGLVGLAPDEVSAVLRKGEEVITEDDPRHRNNVGKKNKETGGASGNIRVVPVLDPSTIHEAISSSQGEEVIIAVMKRRASTIRQVLK